jgi:O-methyltransferase
MRSMKNVVHRALKSFDLSLVRISRTPGEFVDLAEYQSIYPLADYAPWSVCTEFLSTYRTIRHHTLVDIYRCWELWALVEQTAKWQGGILEVGVWRGGSGVLMAKRAAMSGGTSPVFLCDTFEGVVKAGAYDGFYRGGEHSDTSPKIVEDLARSLDVGNVRILKGVFPNDTAHMIDLRTVFRLVHIDVDVYQSAKDVMGWIWERLVPGGVVVYDDYGFKNCDGITKFVNAQIGETDRLVLHNLNGHAIVVKAGS